jgi:hypothetical protein
MDLDLHVNSKMNMERFLITGLGNQKIILGLPWLREHNLEINWKEGILQWRTTTIEEVLDKEEHLNQPTNTLDKVLLEYLGIENELWINSKENLATKLVLRSFPSDIWQVELGLFFIFTFYMFHLLFHHLFHTSFHLLSASTSLFHLTTFSCLLCLVLPVWFWYMFHLYLSQN